MQTKTESKMFDTIYAGKTKSNSNANSVNVGDGDMKPDNLTMKAFHKRGKWYSSSSLNSDFDLALSFSLA